MSVYVDVEECVGCEACVDLCDGVFEMNAAGLAVCLVPDSQLPCVDEAVDICPTNAIIKE
jgi:ferredoxin